MAARCISLTIINDLVSISFKNNTHSSRYGCNFYMIGVFSFSMSNVPSSPHVDGQNRIIGVAAEAAHRASFLVGQFDRMPSVLWLPIGCAHQSFALAISALEPPSKGLIILVYSFNLSTGTYINALELRTGRRTRLLRRLQNYVRPTTF